MQICFSLFFFNTVRHGMDKNRSETWMGDSGSVFLDGSGCDVVNWFLAAEPVFIVEMNRKYERLFCIDNVEEMNV